MVVALRGAGDPIGAWDAAIAGWVRARLAGDARASLRADLDKLVLQGIIPDRVQAAAAGRTRGGRIAAAGRLGAGEGEMEIAEKLGLEFEVDQITGASALA